VAGPLTAARAQDATAWLTVAVALLLAPWGRFWDALDLSRPQPPWLFVLGGGALALVAIVHAVRGGPAAIRTALVADLLAAAVLAAWLVADSPATGDLGTVVLAVTAASLVLQAAFDAVILRQHEA
jgi:hypothetical protein